jgi:hypothetical protein
MKKKKVKEEEEERDRRRRRRGRRREEKDLGPTTVHVIHAVRPCCRPRPSPKKKVKPLVVVHHAVYVVDGLRA